MREPTTIAGLVKSLLEDGVEHEAIVRAVQAAEGGSRGSKPKRIGDRGARLSDNWKPTDADVAYAASFRMPEGLILLEAQKFRNYWTAKTGAGATKRDWSATWRNWILNAMERRHDASARYSGSRAIQAAGRPPTGADAVLAGMGRVSRRLAENRAAAQSGNREAGADVDAPRQIGFEPDAKR